MASSPSESSLHFEIGELADKRAAATVTVKEIVQPSPKRKLFQFKKNTHPPIADGIAVRFEHPEVEALQEIPIAVQNATKSPRILMRRLALFAPGDPVPRLMAEEAVALAPGQWVLRRVLLSDRPGAAECKLFLGKGPAAMLHFPKGAPLALASLLAAHEAP